MKKRKVKRKPKKKKVIRRKRMGQTNFQALKWEKVTESSSVRGIKYDTVNRELWVDFKGAKDNIYRYNNVSSFMFQKFNNALSKGKFISENIRNKYEFDIFPRKDIEIKYD